MQPNREHGVRLTGLVRQLRLRAQGVRGKLNKALRLIIAATWRFAELTVASTMKMVNVSHKVNFLPHIDRIASLHN